MNSPVELGFDHRFIEGRGAAKGITLLLLHGTGGDADSLLQLGGTLYPDATLLSPAGKVLENGARRFFRRFAEGVLDIEDLRRRSAELAQFVRDAIGAYHLDAGRIIAVGYSNGANIAAGLLMDHPTVLGGAVLFRAMVPFVPETIPTLSGVPILLCAGEHDPLVPEAQTEQLGELLRAGDADVTLRVDPGDHALSIGDIRVARDWLAAQFPATDG